MPPSRDILWPAFAPGLRPRHNGACPPLGPSRRILPVALVALVVAAFADHLRHVGRMYPQEKHKRVVLTIDNAPWHKGQPLNEVLKANPHLELYRLPSYSPKLNVIERFWKVLRRRATHNRLFDTIKDLKGSVRNSLRYFQTVRQRLLTLINGRPKKSSQ